MTSIKSISVWTYAASLAAWLSMCVGAAAIVVVLNIRDVEKDLSQYGDAYSSYLNKEMVSSETILKGFSALFGAVGNTDPDKASRYVMQVIDANPQIFALEIVQVVTQNQLARFVAQKRRGGIPNFNVKSFSYDSDRKWQALEEKAVYYPLVFMAPVHAGAEDLLGLDLESVPFLRHAITEALQRRAPVATHPFRLVEGNLAYVVFYPITQAFRSSDSPFALNTDDELVVDMVIDVGKLVAAEKCPPITGQTVIIHHKDFSAEQPEGQLLRRAGEQRSAVETWLFPAFVYQKKLATMEEPFALSITRQVGWSDLSLGLLTLMAVLTVLSTLLLLGYLRAQQLSRGMQMENQKRLWMLANHDSLTGLPNRLLLLDRLYQLLARSSRQQKGLAVMFLDIDDFKIVNDTYGHDVGDQLLKFVAERLRASTRTDDTVARISGDEFIILIESVENREWLEAVKQKIVQKLSDGLKVDDKLIHVRTSIGVALFPEDGETPEALIKQADMRMYADKKNRKVRLRLV